MLTEPCAFLSPEGVRKSAMICSNGFRLTPLLLYFELCFDYSTVWKDLSVLSQYAMEPFAYKSITGIGIGMAQAWLGCKLGPHES